MEKARCNTELYSNLRAPLNNVKPSNFWGSHQSAILFLFLQQFLTEIFIGMKKIILLSCRGHLLPLPPIRGGRVTDYSVSEVTWTSRLSGSFFFAGYAILA